MCLCFPVGVTHDKTMLISQYWHYSVFIKLTSARMRTGEGSLDERLGVCVWVCVCVCVCLCVCVCVCVCVCAFAK